MSYTVGALAGSINLNSGRAVFAGISDTLIGIENATGSSGADAITGGSAANVLRGSVGADTLLGLGGNDTLLGDQGNDALDGGLGQRQPGRRSW